MFYALWLRAQREKLLFLQKQQQAEAQLLMANKQLDRFLAQLKDKNRVLEDIHARLQETQNQTPSDAVNHELLL